MQYPGYLKEIERFQNAQPVAGGSACYFWTVFRYAA
jgi:hypothetical protein